MQWFELFLGQWESLGAWAVPIETAAKSLLLLGLAFATARLLAARSAAARQAVWTATLMTLLALPLMTALGPDWQITVAERVALQPQMMPGQAPDPAHSNVSHGLRPATALPSSSWNAGLWLGVLYFAGVAAVLFRWLLGTIRLQTRLRQSRLVGHTLWRRELAQLARRVGVYRRVRLRTSKKIEAPLSWGIARPVILLPEDALKWSAPVRRTVLLHELIHVRRHDLLLEQLTQLACAFYWCNPLIWMAAHQLRLEREKACDDALLTFGTRPSDYARQLLYMAVRASREPTLAGVGMATHNQLEGRLLAILDPARRRGRAAFHGVLLLLIAAVFAIPLAAFSPAVAIVALESTVQRIDVESHGVSFNDQGEMTLQPEGWFRVQERNGSLRVVEVRSTAAGSRSQTYTVDGALQTWGAGAQELLQRGIDRVLDRASARRDEALMERDSAAQAREEAQVRQQEARARREEVLQRELELREQLTSRTRETEQAARDMVRSQHDVQRFEQDLHRVMQERQAQMQELQQHLVEMQRQLQQARGQSRAQLEQQLADQKEQMADAHRAQAEVRARMETEMRQLHAELMEAERQLAEAHERVNDVRGQVAGRLREIIFDAVDEAGGTTERRDHERIAMIAGRLSRAGNLEVNEDGWTFEPDLQVARDVAESLSRQLFGLTDDQRSELAEKLVDRLASVSN